MKKILAISAAALLGTSLMAAPVLAQVSVDVGGNGGISVGGGSGSAGGTVGGSAGVDAGSGGISAGGNAGAGATVSGDGGSLKLGADASGDAKVDTDSTTAAIGANIEGAMSAMARGGEAAATVGAMTEVSSVNVVKLDAAANADAMAKAETDNKAGIDELRASLAANAAVKAALDAQSVNADDVVAADVNADGSLTVYVR
ncbi:MAG: hypothetical protein KF849_15665 [Rhizobiaceae bacterium]|nr:hypothetical protein [Rhizobiaceae bacterium]